MSDKKFPPQLYPLIIITALMLIGLGLIRHFLVPATFGQYGHYRASSVDEIAALPISFAGIKACAECHDDVYTLKQSSNHAGLSCEVCHGPAASHAADPSSGTPPLPKGRDKCLQCHNYNPSRPSGFPQVIDALHNPKESCMSCHQPHNPTLPQTPEKCEACHREIANEKSVSRHADLDCIKCHTVPEEHKINPSLNKATKPTSKETCAQCHANSELVDSTIPQIDITEHGKPYICWDCHYPHHPEANK